MTLHVAFVTDLAYLPWCATAVLSCIDEHQLEELHIHVVHDGSLTAEHEDQLRSMMPLSWLTVHRVDPAEVRNLPAIDRFGHIVWLRFLLPQLLPSVERVLYLDADTFVAGHLGSLANLDLQGAPLAAVLNLMQPEDSKRVQALGLDPAGYFNSGVLLLDLAMLRREGFVDQVTETVTSLGGGTLWPDQDVLNTLFDGRWHRLHPRYNAQNSLLEWPSLAARALGAEAWREAVGTPVVVHFEGPYVCKPWHALCRHPWRDRYRAVLARTPWSGVHLDDAGWVTRGIGRLPVSWQLPVYEQVVRARQGARPSLRGALRRRRTAIRRAT